MPAIGFSGILALFHVFDNLIEPAERMMARQFGFVTANVIAVLVAWHTPAHAYLDPGTGSMILQGIIGAVVGGLIALKLYWARLKDFLAGRRPRRAADSQDRPSDSN
ncbi:MAG: hypothetical protein HOK54_13860 [Alphaproteobacteria bacterium]|nr:hypothetical protein [Alphaproteobacteria bacterium]